MRAPDAQLRAGHLPADLIPDGVHPRTVVIVQPAPRSYLGPLVLILTATAGTIGTAFAVLALIDLAAQVAATVAAAPLAISSGVGTIVFRKGK